MMLVLLLLLLVLLIVFLLLLLLLGSGFSGAIARTFKAVDARRALSVPSLLFAPVPDTVAVATVAAAANIAACVDRIGVLLFVVGSGVATFFVTISCDGAAVVNAAFPVNSP